MFQQDLERDRLWPFLEFIIFQHLKPLTFKEYHDFHHSSLNIQGLPFADHEGSHHNQRRKKSIFPEGINFESGVQHW